MPVISIFFGILIRLNTREHNPPHIHAEYAGNFACFDIRTGNLTAGNMPERQTRLIQAWIEIHREDLLVNWDLAQSGGEIFRIEPLK